MIRVTISKTRVCMRSFVKRGGMHQQMRYLNNSNYFIEGKMLSRGMGLTKRGGGSEYQSGDRLGE